MEKQVVLVSKKGPILSFLRIFALFSLVVFWGELFPYPLRALLIYDIDTSYQSYVDLTHDQKKTPHLRLVTFDTKKQKIIKVVYLPYTYQNTPVCTSHPHFKVCYGPRRGPAFPITITPKGKGNFWIRSYGTIHADAASLKRLSQWDQSKDKKRWSLYIGKTSGPRQIVLTNLLYRINHLDIETLSKTQKPTQKNPHWKKNHSVPLMVGYKTPHQELSQSVFHLHSDLGNLGELACDLLMLSSGLIKHEGKHGSNQGFDGIYSYPREDIWVVSEAKWWKSCPKLDRIESECLISKFDEQNTRAITKINPELKKKLLQAQNSHHLYLLPLGVFPDGQIYARLRQKPFQTF